MHVSSAVHLNARCALSGFRSNGRLLICFVYTDYRIADMDARRIGLLCALAIASVCATAHCRQEESTDPSRLADAYERDSNADGFKKLDGLGQRRRLQGTRTGTPSTTRTPNNVPSPVAVLAISEWIKVACSLRCPALLDLYHLTTCSNACPILPYPPQPLRLRHRRIRCLPFRAVSPRG